MSVAERALGHAARARRGAPQGHGPGALRRRAQPGGARPRGRSPSRASRAGPSPASARPRPASSPSCSHGNAGALGGGLRRRALRPAGARASTTAARSSPSWWRRRSRRRAPAPRRSRSSTAPSPTTPSSPPTIPASTRRTASTAATRPSRSSGTPRPRWPRAEVTVDQTYGTPVQHNNAMEPHACVVHWRDDGRLIVNETSQGDLGDARDARRALRPRARPGQRALPARRRRLRLQGDDAPAHRRRRAGRQARRPAGQARLHPPAAVRLHGLPHADVLARAAGRHGRRDDHRDRARRRQPDVADQGVHRADGHRRARHVRRRGPPQHAPRHAPRRPHALLVPGTGGDAGHVRPRVRHGRAGAGARDGPGRAAHPQRPARASRVRQAVELAQPRRLPARGRRALRLGRPPTSCRRGRGYGVAASMYPTYRAPAWAHAKRESDGSVTVRIASADIGTGARTVLTQIAADALERGPSSVRVSSSGTPTSRARAWRAARWARRPGARPSTAPAAGWSRRTWTRPSTTRGTTSRRSRSYARHAFGAQFAQVRVDTDSGEVTVDRLLGVFAAGRILNPLTARSQLIGGMTMGLGMALMEETVVDPRLRGLPHRRSRAIPRPRQRRHPRHRGGLGRGGRPAPQSHGQQGHRRDRHHRRGRGHRERRARTPRASVCAVCPSTSRPSYRVRRFLEEEAGWRRSTSPRSLSSSAR